MASPRPMATDSISNPFVFPARHLFANARRTGARPVAWRSSMAKRKLAGSRALLTGASSGIGRALALRLVGQGCRLLVVARRAERLAELVRTAASLPGQLEILAGDITQPQVRAAALARAREAFGGLDLLVNNAGIGATGRFIDAAPERLRRVMEVNFFAPAEMMRESLPALRQGVRPMIVNVASILGHRGIPLCAEYCASKFALIGLSESLRAEFSALGVELLVVSPGTTETDFFSSSLDAAETPWSHRRGVSPDLVARRAVAAIRSGRHEIIVGPAGRLLVWTNRLFPRLVDRMMARYG